MLESIARAMIVHLLKIAYRDGIAHKRIVCAYKKIENSARKTRYVDMYF